MKSERLPDPSKRDFLGLVRAGATLATTGATLGVLSKFSPRKDSAAKRADKARTSEELKDLRERNIKNIEKDILGLFDTEDLIKIGRGEIPNKVYKFSTEYNEAIVKTGLAAAGTLASSAIAYTEYKNRENERKAPETLQPPKGSGVPIGVAVLGAAGLGVTTTVMAKDRYKQHAIEDIKEAEKRIENWVGDYTVNKTKIEDSSADSVKKALNVLKGRL